MDRQYSLSTRLTWPVFCSVSTALLTCREIKGFILLKTSNFVIKKPTLLYKYEIDNMAKNYQYSAQTFVYQVIFETLRGFEKFDTGSLIFSNIFRNNRHTNDHFL